MKVERVSDHAILRYLERVAGVDVERVRSHIAKQLRHAPSGAVKVTTGGIEYRLRNGTVTTVMAVKRAEPAAIVFDDA